MVKIDVKTFPIKNNVNAFDKVLKWLTHDNNFQTQMSKNQTVFDIFIQLLPILGNPVHVSGLGMYALTV